MQSTSSRYTLDVSQFRDLINQKVARVKDPDYAAKEMMEWRGEEKFGYETHLQAAQESISKRRAELTAVTLAIHTARQQQERIYQRSSTWCQRASRNN